MGLLDRFLRRRREEPAADAPGLFTARSLATSEQAPEHPAPPQAPDEQHDAWETPPPPEAVAAAPDTVEAPPPWDEAEARSVETPAPTVEPPVEPDAWDDALWDETPTPAPVVEPVPGDHDAPLFGDHQAPLPAPEAEPEPRPEPEPPLFEPRAAPATPPPRDIETVDDEGRRVRVHDGRLDTRPGPIRMSPSEALRLAEEGPRPSRRRDEPGPGGSA